jgi:outer membrane murein-binding lipoprotein Lpp
MGLAIRVVLLSGLALSTAILTLAGPPSRGGGRGFSGSVSGPAPLRASGAAPLHATGSLIGNPYSAAGQRGGSYTRGGFVNNRGDRRRGEVSRGDRRGYRPAVQFFAPYYYPSLDYGDVGFTTGYDSPYSDSYDSGPGPEDPATEAVLQSQGQLSQQVRHLTSEIEQLREQQNQGGSPYVMRPANAESEQPQNAVPVTLILRGGRTLKVKDYAVMNGVLWDFTVQPARKIAVSEVDVEASAKATQAAGGEFPDLSASGQQEN